MSWTLWIPFGLLYFFVFLASLYSVVYGIVFWLLASVIVHEYFEVAFIHYISALINQKEKIFPL